MDDLHFPLFPLINLTLAIFLFHLTKRKSEEIQQLSQKRELDRYVFWNLVFHMAVPHKVAPVFIFPYDRENETVVRALNKARWIGLSALVMSGLFFVSCIGFILTTFVGSPGMRAG